MIRGLVMRIGSTFLLVLSNPLAQIAEPYLFPFRINDV